MCSCVNRVTVYLDLKIHRRKRVHEIQDTSGQPLAHFQTIGEIFRWLVDNDHQTVCLIDDEDRYLVTIDTPPWQRTL